MKNFSALILLVIAFILFLIGISIPGINRPIHIIFVMAGMLLGFIFYLRVFREVLTSSKLSRGERILWIVAIVCLPMIGNMFYIIIHNSAESKQIPDTEI